MRKIGLTRWTVIPALALLVGASAPGLAHQGRDHSVKEPSAAPRGAPAPSAPSARAGGTRWGASYFPNVALTTHEGKTVRFFDDLIKDRVVVIYFMYTSCEDSCPLETAQLVNVQRILGDRVGKDVFMYSITIDPARDTPEVLAEYAAKYNVGPGWLFLTGNEADITLLRRKLGLYREDLFEDPADHNISLVIGNQSTGQWMKRSPFDNPYFLAAQIGSWLRSWKMPSDVPGNSYAQAPKLRNISQGESLFRGRCSVCHTIGEGDVMQVQQNRVGPDLLGVTQKRERAWLARWLAEPDKMLAERDPIAMALYARYNNLPMPNLRLNEIEVDALIEYMEAESRRVEQTARLAAERSLSNEKSR